VTGLTIADAPASNETSSSKGMTEYEDVRAYYP
jgi:hypothetical protein